jgi:Domain of unknown function (DUF4159)
MKVFFKILVLSFAFSASFAQNHTIKIAKLKYNGGGDWYANKTALPNLINFCNTNLKTNIFAEEDIIEPGDPKIFQYPYVYMTGHGNVLFSDQEAKNMRKYLLAGGFFHIDDNYGLNKFIRREMKKVFPEHEFVEIPFNHPIYHQKYDFARGLPKVHEHDNKPPQGYGIIHEGKLICFFSYECDLGNGWEDQVVYNDPEYVRLEALKMGANLIQFCFSSF